jgi:hypothetical protein
MEDLRTAAEDFFKTVTIPCGVIDSITQEGLRSPLDCELDSLEGCLEEDPPMHRFTGVHYIFQVIFVNNCVGVKVEQRVGFGETRSEWFITQQSLIDF